jgi:heat shock protein HslJ
MDNDNFKNSINEIHEVKMSFDEKSQIFKNIVNFRAPAIKRQSSFSSFILLMQRNHLVTYAILFILIFVTGSGVVFDLLSNKNNQTNNNIDIYRDGNNDIPNFDNITTIIKNNDAQEEDDSVTSTQKINPPIISKNIDNNTGLNISPPAGGGDSSLGIRSSSTGSQQEKILFGAWVWDKTILNNGSIIKPQKKGAFVITFSLDKKVNGQTDCNNFFGSYDFDNLGNLNFGPLVATEMHCYGSEERIFMDFINKAKSYEINSSNNLIIFLSDDSGYLVFIKK